MAILLHIDASVRALENENVSHNSISKGIAKSFVDTLLDKNPDTNYIYRDVGINPPPFINQEWIGAVFTPEDNRTEQQRKILSISDQLISEVTKAHIILISSPMYNYGMPAQLKAWFDQIVRINKTFDFDLARGDFPLKPMLSGKTLIIVTSCGEFGFDPKGIRAEANHLTPHLKTLSKYLGVDSIYEIHSEYQEFTDERHAQSVANAHSRAIALATELLEVSTDDALHTVNLI